MEVTVEDVMNLPSTKNCKVVAGRLGLCKTVRWFLGLLSPVVEPWVHEHEVLFVYGTGMDTSDSALSFLLEQCANKEVSAVFLIIGPVFERIPEAVIARADELKLPLIEMPNEVPVVDVTKEMAELIMNRRRIWDEKGILLKNLLFGHESDCEKYGKQLGQVGVDFELHSYMNIICIRFDKQEMQTNSSIGPDVEQTILSLFPKNLYFWNDDNELVLLVNNIERNIAELEQTCKKFVKHLLQIAGDVIVGIGIGNTVPDIVNVPESYQNAGKALCYHEENQIVSSYEQLSNIRKLLSEVDSGQVLRFCFQNTLGKILEYDEQHESSLLNTLRVYLEEEGNISKSSQKLFIHRNTMVYRINKINGLLGMEIEKVSSMIELNIAFCCYDQFVVNHNQ